MLILNFKNYPQSVAPHLEDEIKAISTVIKENPSIINQIYLAPSIIDTSFFKMRLPQTKIVAQHVDLKLEESTTGWISTKNLMELGVTHSLYNHSEHRINRDDIIENIKNLQALGIKLIVCCENLNEAEIFLEAQPFAIAFEPPDLIGTGVSVTTRPEIIDEFVKQVQGSTIPIVGAGVSSGNDVETALKLGAKGVLIASAFTNAENKLEKLNELAKPFLD